MSLINKMLQELDKRHAAQGGPPTAESLRLAQNLRPVKPGRMGSELFWRVIGGVMLIVVAWVIWVVWQITPRSVVTELAYQSVNRTRPSQQPPEAKVAVAPAIPAPAGEGAHAALSPAASRATTAAQPRAATSAATELPIDMLRFATEITTPISGGRPRPAPTAKSVDKETIAALKPGAPAAKAQDRRVGPTFKAETVPPKLRAGAVTPDSGRIDKRVDASPHERAETEFRRAMGYVNQGRMAEGMEGLRAALSADPALEEARQTLVALLIEAKRNDEAAGALQEGLAINPANAGFAVLLARINVERGDLNGALALLLRHEAATQNNAEYRAFVAALYQRLGRHPLAIEQYQVALRLAPGVGAWWVGLGISQEASERPKEAVESFRRAKAAANLSTELAAYVERRLKQLQ